LEETIQTNYFGPRRVNDAFTKILKRPGGRIVNVASASGPNFIADLPHDSTWKQYLAKPWTIPGGISQLDEIARSMYQQQSFRNNIQNAYGASKALLNAYTALHAKSETDWIINSCTPGFIQTDMTKGTSPSNPPARGAIPPCYLMMDEETIPRNPTGRYYGSDCVRSPIAFYRGPGEPPYESNEDLEAEWPSVATTTGTTNVE
jgi:NAD(P)-dependent dehydrogenase (short-subunit alcohol dehydrogenase family)